MQVGSVTYKVRMDARTFRAFAVFDTFIFKKHWRLPVCFFLIMAAFALVAALSGKPQSWLIATVLCAVGLGMPALYAGTFLSGVKKQARALGLDAKRPVYTVALTRGGINVHNDLKEEDDVRLEWDKLYKVIRRKDCFYLYAVPQKAFILPDGDADSSAAEAFEFIARNLPGDKRKSLTRPPV